MEICSKTRKRKIISRRTSEIIFKIRYYQIYKGRAIKLFKRSLKRSISLAKKNNSNFYFFYIFSPESISLMKQSKKNPNLEDVKKITSELGIQIYFAFDSLSDYNKDIFYPRFGGHFSEEGYRNIAENVYKKIAP